jgi:AbrB family looped-hinge helix DNA binding protein
LNEGVTVARVKVSSKYQIVIPREVRETLGLRKGEMVSVIPVGGVIEVVPDRDLSTLEGAFPQISLTGVRDESEREEGRSTRPRRRRSAA